MNGSILNNLLLMDGQGLYVWAVLLILIFVIVLNLYLPHKNLKKIKLVHRLDNPREES
tara:strand:+ start:1688 stop:1861 length:174 start_codon:yes stop_codon:yes gene_type:complete